MAVYDHLEYDVREGRAEVLIDRPESLNAFTDQTLAELTDALYAAHDDDRVYAIVLSGAGRGFCSGVDVEYLDVGADKRFEENVHLWKTQNVARVLYQGPKPTIAAINGPAVGAGCGFALACDLRVMSESAFLREQFVNVGIVPGSGDGYFLPELVGESKAKEYLLTGKDISPAAAEDMGLVVEVVPEDETMAVARDLANTIRDRPGTAVRNTKRLVNETDSFDEYAAAATDALWECLMDPEQDEAVAAMLDGRNPEYDREY